MTTTQFVRLLASVPKNTWVAIDEVRRAVIAHGDSYDEVQTAADNAGITERIILWNGPAAAIPRRSPNSFHAPLQ